MKIPTNVKMAAVAAFTAFMMAGCMPDMGWARSAGYSHLYVFGDSYSDDGAAEAISGDAVRARITGAVPLPAAPASMEYWHGRWSNGPTAVEYLARKLGVGLTNLAVGGARCGSGNYFAWLDGWRDTGLRAQVLSFIAANRRVDPDALYVLGASANDFLQKMDYSTPVSLPDMAFACATDVADATMLLIRHGARHFMVFGSYGLDTIPAVAASAAAVAQARQFETDFDQQLRAALLPAVQAGNATIGWFSWKAATDAIIHDAARYHIRDVTTPCQVTLPQPRKACARPDTHLWWDEIHPTGRAHGLVAAAMMKALRCGPHDCTPPDGPLSMPR